MPPAPRSNILDERMQVLRMRWDSYANEKSFENFTKFAVTVNSLAECLNRMRLPGLVRICEVLESLALSRVRVPVLHPLSLQDVELLQQQVESLLSAVESSRLTAPERRAEEPEEQARPRHLEWIKPRLVWLIVVPEMKEMANILQQQIRFFGFFPVEVPWDGPFPDGDPPLAVVFIPEINTTDNRLPQIAKIRALCTTSQMIYLGTHQKIENTVELMHSGIDISIPVEEGTAAVINCILDLVQSIEPEQHRVLVVGTTRVAVKLIQRTLSEHDIDSRAIRGPEHLLDELQTYQPDLILMGMYMPGINGVETTRVLRQMPTYRSLPIIYLSSESDVGMQVEALRLGGDQFLNTPFNPVILAAVVKTRIERFRQIQRSTQHDGLTGLLNHTAAKSALQTMVAKLPPFSMLTVVMIDIDHFKSVNDTYGHPVGDLVIRDLGWLLKGRLRSSDLIGRYGGEEFLIALPDITPEQAHAVIDSVRKDFSSLPHTHANGVLRCTFSAGTASFPEFTTAPLLTEAADFALLRAKQKGRNQVRQAKADKNGLPASQSRIFPENLTY